MFLPDTIDDVSLRFCGLTDKAVNALAKDGITTIGQFNALSDVEALKIPNMGEKILSDLRKKVAAVSSVPKTEDYEMAFCVFWDARVNSERNTAIIEALACDRSMVDIAKEFGVSPSSVSTLFQNYRYWRRTLDLPIAKTGFSQFCTSAQTSPTAES